MSKTAKLQQKINLLRLELRMSKMVNTQLLAEVVEGNRVINALEDELKRKRAELFEFYDCSREDELHVMLPFNLENRVDLTVKGEEQEEEETAEVEKVA